MATGKGRGSSRGVVVEYSPDRRSFGSTHENVTRSALARRIAALKGFDYAGTFDPAGRYSGPVYFVPNETLVGIRSAQRLGIRSEHDLFGGVVPHSVVASKTITHPLVRPDAQAPAGWSHLFPIRVRDAVLAGFSAFTVEDVRRAGLQMLEHGPVRIKPGYETGGRGQCVVCDASGLEATIAAMDKAEMSSKGYVVEENLTGVITYSVGQVHAAGLLASYFGTQRLTADNSGAEVYGGSDLVIARGDFQAFLGFDISDEVRLAVAQARTYDGAAMEIYAGMFASRRNYDVVQGLDGSGRRRSGVLEQSWRVGGASGAEIAALEAFQANPDLKAIRASTVEIYGESATPPPQAVVYFRGIDDDVGPLTKYTLVETYGDPR